MDERGAGKGTKRGRLALAWLLGFIFLAVVTLDRIGHPSRLAGALLAEGRPRAAALAGRWGVIATPDDARAWFVLGEALRVAERPAEAAAAYDEAAGRADEGALLTRIGEGFARLGRADEARAAWRLAVDRPFPRVDDALDAYAALSVAQGRGGEALDVLAAAAERLDPKGVGPASAAGNRAVVLARLGRADEARATIAALAERFPGSAVAAFKAAETAAVLGDRTAALAALEAARGRPFHHPCWLEIKLAADARGPGAFADLHGDARYGEILRWAADWRRRLAAG